MSVGRPSGSSRALRLDPFALPVRYGAHDGGADGQIRQIELTRDRVVVRRAVRGIPMNVGVPVTAFHGVSMRLVPADGNEPAAVTVTLEHRDPGLSVPLFWSTEAEDAAAIWKSWGRVLGVPLLVVEGDGTLREPFRRIGRVNVGNPQPRRRRRSAVKWRRSRFAMRRKAGRQLAEPIIYRGEHEISARN